MTDKVSLRDVALGFSAQRVGSMKKRIEESFARRDVFEASQGLALAASSSYTVERDRMLKASAAVAMMFLALDIAPSDVIERKVSSTSMFNAKALKKVTELAIFVAGYGDRLEKVTKAFLACAITATDKGVDIITNAVNRRFLNSESIDSLVTDSDLRDYIADARLRTMTSGDATQSSQIRNVLDVLGVGQIVTVDKPRDAIALDADHALLALFRERYMVAA